MVSVVEARRNIAANRVITAEDLRVVEVEESTIGPGTARSTGQVIGLTTSGSVVNGQRILMANLASPGLSHLVDDGLRAVAIPIDRLNALGGMVRVDDNVDIVFSVCLNLINMFPFEAYADPSQTDQPEPVDVVFDGSDPTLPASTAPDKPQLPLVIPAPGEPGSRYLVVDQEEGSPVTKVVLQNIRVVRVIAGDVEVDSDAAARPAAETPEPTDPATDPDLEPPHRLPRSDLLILEVNAEQAELIKFMLDTSGRFLIVLRSTGDNGDDETAGMSYERLVTELGLPVPITIEVPAPVEGEE
jgi:pilus assembly protein CpaB